MFRPIYLLPQYNEQLIRKYQGRWETPEGLSLRETILAKIREGAGEDFLQWDFEQGKLRLLEDYWDLKGILFQSESIGLSKFSLFEALNFSYASFYNSKFRNASFEGPIFNFTKIVGCEFTNCTFLYTYFYGTTIEKTRFVNCDFIDRNHFVNCDIKETNFTQCFYNPSLFNDCKFDEETIFDNPLNNPSYAPDSATLRNSSLAEFYKGIKDGYGAGGVVRKAREYSYKEHHSITRYNSVFQEKIAGYFLELVSGYGLKPMRVLASMLILFLLFTIAFVVNMGSPDGVLLSAGAFFTFGGNIERLQNLNPIFIFAYVTESFLGIAFMAFFITVLAKYWFAER